MSAPPSPELAAQQDRTLLKVLPIALLVGLVLAVWGVYLAQFHVGLILDGATATGRVVALESGTSSSGSSRAAWFPVVEFETLNGQVITFRHRTGRSSSPYAEGDLVSVTYLPGAPEDALIAEGFWNWLLPLVLLMVGSGLTVISLRAITGARRRLRPLNGR